MTNQAMVNQVMANQPVTDQHNQTPLLTVKDLKMQFGGLVAVDNVSFELQKKQIAAVIGPNGAGKTTIFNCISGFYTPTAGSVSLDGENITGKPSHVIAQKGLTRTFQNIRLFSDMTVLENLLIAQHSMVNKSYVAGLLRLPSFRRSEQKALASAIQWLDVFDLAPFANREAGNLSYGQQRRLEMARCMILNPKVLILDEPAAGLNPQETKALIDLIRRLRDDHNVSVLLIEHDMNLIMNISENILVVEYGRPIAEGTPDEIRNNETVIKAYLGEE